MEYLIYKLFVVFYKEYLRVNLYDMYYIGDEIVAIIK